MEKWKSCNPSIAEIDQRINEVTDQLYDLLASVADSQVGFFTLRTGLLVHDIQMHTKKWVAAYGDLLRERAQTIGRQLRDSIQVRTFKKLIFTASLCDAFVFDVFVKGVDKKISFDNHKSYLSVVHDSYPFVLLECRPNFCPAITY